MLFGTLQDLTVFRSAERYSDRLYALGLKRARLDVETTGNQLVRAADSVGANIAESFGRFHYSERAHFLYYARGSAYETIYWLWRAERRNLLPPETTGKAIELYTELITSLNRFIRQTKQRKGATSKGSRSETQIAESSEPYLYETDLQEEDPF